MGLHATTAYADAEPEVIDADATQQPQFHFFCVRFGVLSSLAAFRKQRSSMTLR